MQPRTIIINQSNGTPMQEVETLAQTWGELQTDLDNAGIRYSGMKAILGETNTTLESNNARLPLEGTMNIYLLPRRTKSGATSSKNKIDMKKAETKSEKAEVAKKKVASTKKAVVKVDTTKEKATLPKKTVKSSLQQAAKEAIAETKKEMDDVEIVMEAINLLRTVKNPNVRVKIDAQIADLDDISYIIATGKPRKDNLKSKKLACELMQDNNLGLQQNC